MKIRIVQTINVDDEYRAAINRYHGQDGLASREEVRDWVMRYGESMDDDIMTDYVEYLESRKV